MKFMIPYNIFEMNTENDDHTVGNNWYLNNDKKFGEETPVDLPLDYFNEPEEEGDVDEEDYYSTPAGKSGLYNGVAPQKGGGLKKTSKAIYSMSAESINVQDIMSFPTFITKSENIKERLKSYYSEIKRIPGVENLTNIMEEKIDKRIGFSFILLDEKILILADDKNINLLVNNQLIPLNNTDNLFNIIQGEI